MDSLPALVTSELNEIAFSMRFVAQHRLYPETDASKLESVLVSVYDGPRASEQDTRGGWQYTDTIYIVVQRRVEAESAHAIVRVTELIHLLREIESHFEQMDTPLGGRFRFMQFDESSPRQAFSLDELRTSSVYTTVVGLEFESWSEE